MIQVLLYIGGIVVVLGAVVVIHEAGHFAVARLCRVGVLDFSFGFGRSLASYRSRSGVLFNWRVLPLGGFVRMLDRLDPTLDEQTLQRVQGRYYQDAPIWQRILILLAGPFANFVLTAALMWLVFSLGVPAAKPLVGDVEPGSIVDLAGMRVGDEIIALDGREVLSFQDIVLRLVGLIGEKGELSVRVRRDTFASPLDLRLSLQSWDAQEAERELLGSLGLTPPHLVVPARIGGLQPGSPATRAQLRQGDLLLAVDGVEVRHWNQMAQLVADRPGREVPLLLERDGVRMATDVTLDSHVGPDGQALGSLGVRAAVPPRNPELFTTLKRPWYTAWMPAVRETFDLVVLTFNGLYKLVSGVLSPDQLAGPIGVAQFAGEAANISAYALVRVLAIISVSIGAINLVPLPPLDGGKIAVHLVEWVRRREFSDRWQLRINAAGTLFLLVLFALVISIDVARLL